MEPLNCDELEPLLAPYADDEMTQADRERVVSHLERCRPCAVRAAGQQAARRLLRMRGRALAPAAPPGLHMRCAALARRRASRRRGWAAWRGWSLAAATAVIVVFTGVIGYGAATHSPTLFVAGLTLDHIKCFAFQRGAAPASPQVLETRMEHDYGWHVAVPPSIPSVRLTLVGARRCLSSDGAIAHVLYRHDGKPLSLFVLPESAHRPSSMSFAGYPARIWSRGGTTYVLVGSGSDAEIQPVARYFQARY